MNSRQPSLSLLSAWPSSMSSSTSGVLPSPIHLAPPSRFLRWTILLHFVIALCPPIRCRPDRPHSSSHRMAGISLRQRLMKTCSCCRTTFVMYHVSHLYRRTDPTFELKKLKPKLLSLEFFFNSKFYCYV